MWSVKHHTREKYGEEEVWVHAASTLAKDGIQQSIHGLAALYVRNKAYHLKFAKSMHHHTIQLTQPTRCNNFSSLLLDVYVQLNRFRGRPHTHHQELNNCSSSLWFYCLSMVVAVLLVVVGPVAGNRSVLANTLQSPTTGPTRGCYCSCWVPKDGREDARNMLSCT